jgi:alpha-glucosidase
MLALPGGAYIYQGEELALPEVREIPEDRLEDPRWHMSSFMDKGRDGCRVPLPWSSSSDAAFGFSTNKTLNPDRAWLPQPEWWGSYSAESQEDNPLSTLNMYRRALEIRRNESGLGDGDLEWIDLGSDVLAFKRAGDFICIVNFGDEFKLPNGEVLISSAPLNDLVLPRDCAVWMQVK